MKRPNIIKLNEIADIIYEKFKKKPYINCYIGSNVTTPTASITAITDAIKSGYPKLPFIKMIHLLLLGKVPYVEKGLEDRIKAYSIFSGGDVAEAANEGRAYYLPCTLGNMETIIGKGSKYEPDLVILKVTQNKYTHEYSMGLSVEALHTAIDNAKIVIAELDENMPFTLGQSILDAKSIDYIITDGIKPVYDIPAPDFDNMPEAEKKIGELITEHFIRDGATLQAGIGKIPNAVIGTIKEANYKDLGIQTEVYSDGLMTLQKMEIVTNRKKKLDMGYSTTSIIIGSKELYEFVHMRLGVQMRSCLYTNSVETVRQNAPFISVNTSMGIDLFGNVWADFVDSRRYYSGVGGQPDFIRAINDRKYGVPIIAMKSVTDKGESKIVKTHPSGVSLTASSYDGVVLVTEYGIADLRGLTVGAKAIAIASVAHPKYKDEMLKYIYDDPLITKPLGYSFRFNNE